MRGGWPIVGRHEELAFIEEIIGSPEVRSVVLVGSAGVGKTRLAREAVAAAAGRGLGTAWASGLRSASRLPFGALAHLLPVEPLTSQPGTLVNLLATAGDALLERAGQAPVLLAVDDAHLVDELTAALVHHLTSTARASVLVTVRAGEQAPDGIGALWKDGLAARLDLRSLGPDEIDELTAHALEGQVEHGTLILLREQTKGNPLLLRELIIGGIEQGALVKQRGVWRWRGPIRAAPRLRELIESRLGTLSTEEQAALEVVATAELIGRDLLEELIDPDVIDALERRAIIEERPDGRRRFVGLVHPLHTEVVRAGVPRGRARKIERRLADLVEGRGVRRSEDLLRVATWRLESGGNLDPDLLLEAARRALSVSEFGLSARLASAAWDAGAGLPAKLLVADSLCNEGRFAEADDLLEGLEQPTSDIDVGRVAVQRAWNLFWHLGRAEEAVAIVHGAEDAVRDPLIANGLRATRAAILVFMGRVVEGLRLADDLLAREDLPPNVLVELARVGWGLTVAGRTHETIELMRRARAVVNQADLTHANESPAWIRNASLGAEFVAGRLQSAAAGVEEMYREAADQRSPWEQGAYAWELGWISLTQGRIQTARRWLREAAVVLREVDMFSHRVLCLSDLAQAEALLGNLQDAHGALLEAEDARTPWIREEEIHLRLALVWIAAARGETSHAAQIALDAAEVVGDMGQIAHQATALHDAARLGQAKLAAEPLADLTDRFDGVLAPTYARHAVALARDDAEELKHVADAFERMGAKLYAAEAAAAAARSHARAGRRGSAQTCAAQARRLAHLTEGARTPALMSLDAPPNLTRREHEIAGLAVSGLTNREIAERLFLSVRTVGNHLQNVYGKLGIGGRDDLRRILGEERPPELFRT